LKTILLSLLILSSIRVLSQPKREQFFGNILLSEIYTVPSGLSDEKDSTETLYYVYKIPYDRLVFEKNDDHYTASYRLTVEVHDSVTNTINRKIKEDKISTGEFEKTDDNSTYAEGVMDFQISRSQKYKIIPVLYDANSDREIRLMGIPILPGKHAEHHGFLEPLVTSSVPQEEMNENSLVLANFDGCIPFSKEKYDLIIPCSDTALQKIYVTLKNNEDTVFSGKVTQSFILGNSIKESGDAIILDNNNSSEVFKNFLIPYVNKNLPEGEITISISPGKNLKPAAVFHKNVRWFDRPFSLINPEMAIKFLKYMENDTVIDSLLDFKKEEYSKVLFNYWKRFDPTPETAYNELMKEYYSRIDYTMKNFSSITGKRGFDTDRGKIFILYGKPTQTERTSNQLGKIVETWVYKNPYRKFVFIDETGTGEYKLKNS
jgi:GWxTD domain-containing protein